MSGERKRVLDMLGEGKISASEAEQLLDALNQTDRAEIAGEMEIAGEIITGKAPKFMYVKVASAQNDNVDIKVPLALLGSGLRLTSLIPPKVMDQINASMEEQGMSFDFGNLRPDDIEGLIRSLGDLEVNVSSKDGDNVRVYCA